MKTASHRFPIYKARLVIATSALALFGAANASADEIDVSSPIRNRTIGYVMTSDHWAVYATPDKSECPKGINAGPRELFYAWFPDSAGKRKQVETELKEETYIWWPDLEAPGPMPIYEAVSKTAPGLNLDGKVGPNDYVSPSGEAGIDNQFYHAVGCIGDYRPDGSFYVLQNNYLRQRLYMRFLIELTDVDDLINDDDVTVTTYRGTQPIVADATGNDFLPYSSQKIDMRFGKKFITRTHGKIKNGVLTTEPADQNFPYNFSFDDRGVSTLRGSQLKLNLLPDKATGLWGGYLDIQGWFRSLNGAMGTHSLSYGQQFTPMTYHSMLKWADGYPDPKTGKNTAISAAKEVVFRQAFIMHPDKAVSSSDDGRKDTAARQLAQNPSR